MTISFAEKTAVVTGAGGAIGRAHAVELARRGAQVVVNDLNQVAVEAVVQEIISAEGKAVGSFETVATAAGGAAIIETALSAFGKIDILVNNAGILRPNYFGDLTTAEIDAVLDTHLRASFFVTQPAWREMQRNRYGRIIMTSSSSGMFGHQGLANYAAAKAGIYGLTKALAYEGAEFGIKVNALLPFADSQISVRNPIPGLAENFGKYVTSEQQQKLAGWRRGPDTIAPVVAYLASEECEVSGEAFSVLSGRVARMFVGVTDGWLAPGREDLTAEGIASHLNEIRALDRHSVPMWLYQEYAAVADRI